MNHRSINLSGISRFGNLGSVFKNGESGLLNEIARISVLYEDLRLEIGELKAANTIRNEIGAAGIDHFRVLYFIRRALVTLVEFRRALTTIRIADEFKLAESGLSPTDAKYILKADAFFQANGDRIKALRNEFGGHLQPAAIRFATSHLSNVTGKITRNRMGDGWTVGLECDFAGDIASGALTRKLQDGSDVSSELEQALTMISWAFNHAQAGTAALVNAFLWDRFGR